MRIRIPSLSLSLAAAIFLVGCADNAQPRTSAAPTTHGLEASTAPGAMTPEPTFRCPPHGGDCRGPLDAGTYTTRVFSPAITYTVPDGWENGEDLPGNFLLQLAEDVRYLGIYRDIAAPLGCQEGPDASVGQTVTALTAWLTSHEGLVTTQPEPVSIGGLQGAYIDISLDPGWTVTCSFSDDMPVVPFIIGGGVSSLHHVILPGFVERLYLLEFDGGNVVIEVGPEGGSLSGYLEHVMPIIESLEFGG